MAKSSMVASTIPYGKTGDKDYCEISTIHTFCLNNILRYFYWRLEEYSDGFTILPSDSDRFHEIVSSVCSEYGLSGRARDQFELLNRKSDGTPITSDQITADVAIDFWERLKQEKYMDFPNIIYYSYRILAERPSITHALACRFSWILVDEFQDTSALQVEILRLIADKGRTKFFLVGDPYQSIYGFAGARPYKRNHLFALLAEQICAYIDHPQPSLIPQIERELFTLLNNATSTFNYNVFSYSGRTTVFRLIKKGIELHEQYDSGIQWLNQAVREFSKILYRDEFLPRSRMHLLIESVDDMKNDMIKNEVDVENLSVSDLGIFASTQNNLHLRTIHRAKGLEFDAVAVIDLHEGRIPHFSASTSGEINEARRLLYVALTRAKRILMYFTDDEDLRIGPSRFLYSGELDLIRQTQ